MYVGELLVMFAVVLGLTHTRRHYALHKFKHNSHWYKDSKHISLEGITRAYDHLPDAIAPIEYYLKILPKIADNEPTFIGETMVMLYVHQDTNQIILNAAGLNFNASDVSVYKTAQQDGLVEHIKVISVQFESNREQVVIVVEKDLKASYKYNLVINYTGTRSENLVGFYRSWYTDRTGTLRWIGVTHSEPTNARRIFPCFDEPRFKTPFTIQIARSQNTRSISMSPSYTTTIPDENIDNYVWDIYHKTIPLATYLVGFCVYEFPWFNYDSTNVCVQPDVRGQTDYIANKTDVIVNKLSEYTSILYDISEHEIVIVPDYTTEGVQNWAMMMVRERESLFKPGVSTILDKQTTFTTAVHTLASHWFGNLITPKWWNYIWLNEALACYMKYYITSLVEPTWDMTGQFVVRELQQALSEDVGQGHPMNSYLQIPTFTDDTIFDVYVQRKGCSILRMLEGFLGAKTFQNGIKSFLSFGIYQSAGVITPNTFWTAINDILPPNLLPEGATIFHIMDKWTRQRGFPLVTITRNYTNNTAIITQEEFLQDRSKDPSDRQWWIPLTFTYDKELDFEAINEAIWLKPNETLTVIPQTDGWIIFNVQQIGYYRVNYDEENWDLLTDQLITNYSVIHPINRAQIIDDSFALAEAGIIKYDIPISLSYYLVLESDFVPWFTAIRAFRRLLERFHETSAEPILKKYLQHIMKPIYVRITNMPMEAQTHTDKMLIKDILCFASEINLKDCERDLISIFNEWSSSKSSYILEPEIKEAVFCTGIKRGSEQSWNDVWMYYKKSKVPTERFAILKALACSTNPNTIKTYLNVLTAIKPPLDIRLHDYKHVFSFAISHPWNRKVGLKWLTENYKVFQNDARRCILKSFFEILGQTIRDEDVYKTLQEFYSVTKEQFADGNLNITIENALIDIKDRIERKGKLNLTEIVEYMEMITKDLTYIDDNPGEMIMQNELEENDVEELFVTDSSPNTVSIHYSNIIFLCFVIYFNTLDLNLY